MKNFKKIIATVFMAAMMTVSASFAGMAETSVEIVSEESHDSAESQISDSSDSHNNSSFETTDKMIEDHDSVEFDEADTPEVKKEEAKEVPTTISSGTIDKGSSQSEAPLIVDEIVTGKSQNQVIIHSETETLVNAPMDNSYFITGKMQDLENSTQFETTSKVVDNVDVVEFDTEPVEDEVIVPPEVPEENVPTDVPPVVEIPKPEPPVSEPEPPIPEPEPPIPETESPVPEPEAPAVPSVPATPEKERPNRDPGDRNHDDDHDDYEVTIVLTPIPVIPTFVEEPSPCLTEIPIFMDEPTPSALPKTGDTTPISVYVFLFSLLVLLIICLHWETVIFLEMIERFQNESAIRIRCGCMIPKSGDVFLCRKKLEHRIRRVILRYRIPKVIVGIIGITCNHLTKSFLNVSAMIT